MTVSFSKRWRVTVAVLDFAWDKPHRESDSAGTRPAIPEDRAGNISVARDLAELYGKPKRGRVEFFFSTAIADGQKEKSPPATPERPSGSGGLERSRVFAEFGGLPKRSAFAAPASPRSSLRTTSARMDHDVIFVGLRFLAFAVRLLVGRADERAFDEYVSALLDSRSDTLCQKWPEHNDTMPLRFRAPFVICVLP